MNPWLKAYSKEVNETKKILVELQFQDTGKVVEYSRFYRVIDGMYNEIIRLQNVTEELEKKLKEKKTNA